LIGEGGMATVYLARDLRHNRKVALKVLRPDLAAVLGVDRFLSEIEVTANLQHPNLLPLFDSGAAGDLLFYVMPYVPGESLRTRIDREKQLPVDEAVRLATAIANALDYAHRQGVIHRDLKPENVLLQEGQPLVADFGIALAVSKAGGPRVTQTGLSLGTPQYMSPEQATGDRVIDARTDIYSLGALTYEMLTGEPPHVGTTAQAIIARLLTERPRSARTSRPAIPEHVEGALDKALEKLPADRWATAHEFAEALAGTRPVTRVQATVTTRAEAPRNVRIARLREGMAWTAVLALGTATAWLAGGDSTRQPRTAAGAVEFELERPDTIAVGGGSANSVAITPDGRTVVFVGRLPNQKRQLYSRSLADRTLKAIPGSDDASAVSVSADGSELLFPTSPGTASAVWRLPLGGGSPRQFTGAGTSNGQHSWGADGRVLYASENRLYIKHIDEGAATLLAAPDTARRHLRYGFPEWLPGQRLALISIWRGVARADSVIVGVLDVEDGSVRELDVYGMQPRYSGTGHLLYVTVEGVLYAAPFDAKAGTLGGKAFTLQQGVNYGSGAAATYAVAQDGTLAVFTTGVSPTGFTVQLVSVDRNGARRNLGIPAGNFRRPRLSPDGTQVTFVGSNVASGATTEAQLSDVWRADIAAVSLSRVTTGGVAERPQFARDGQRIVFTASPPDGSIFAVGLEADAVPQLLTKWPRAVVTGDLGPPGGYAAFGVTGGTSGDIWIAPMDALDKPQPFAADPTFTEALPRISPDGRHVAYTSSRTGVSEIYVRQLPSGGEELRISVAGGVDPVWARSGREIFYRTPDSLFVATLTSAPRLAVASRRSLFALGPLMAASPTSGAYDVLPGDREFVMFESAQATTPAEAPLLVRLHALRRGP
jgi:serine/threonine-protein kinase